MKKIERVKSVESVNRACIQINKILQELSKEVPIKCFFEIYVPEAILKDCMANIVEMEKPKKIEDLHSEIEFLTDEKIVRIGKLSTYFNLTENI